MPSLVTKYITVMLQEHSRWRIAYFLFPVAIILLEPMTFGKFNKSAYDTGSNSTSVSSQFYQLFYAHHKKNCFYLYKEEETAGD